MRSMPPSVSVGAARAPSLAGDMLAAAASARIGFASTLAAWPVLAGRAMFYVLIMVILSALWDKVAAEHLRGTLASALPAGGLAIYVGVTEWITFSVPSVHLRLEDDIRGGLLEPHLLRPKSYLVQKVAEAMGGTAARFLVMGATAVALLTASGRAWPPLTALPAILALGVLGAAVGTMLFTLAGLTAFWIRRVLPPYLIVQKLVFLLGGLFAPVTLYPPWLRDLALASPFSAHLGFAGLAALSPATGQVWTWLALQGLWLALLGVIALAMWRAGLAKTLREGV